jgi:RCC1 and BTB domain-containing protein
LWSRSHLKKKKDENEVYAWGDNLYGQLGTGNNEDKNAPALVSTLKNKKVKRVHCGGIHSFCITEDGELYSWGGNESGQLGLGSRYKGKNSPQRVRVGNNEKVAKLITGWLHCFCQTGDISILYIFIWFNEQFGALHQSLGTHMHGETIRRGNLD